MRFRNKTASFNVAGHRCNRESRHTAHQHQGRDGCLPQALLHGARIHSGTTTTTIIPDFLDLEICVACPGGVLMPDVELTGGTRYREERVSIGVMEVLRIHSASTSVISSTKAH